MGEVNWKTGEKAIVYAGGAPVPDIKTELGTDEGASEAPAFDLSGITTPSGHERVAIRHSANRFNDDPKAVTTAQDPKTPKEKGPADHIIEYVPPKLHEETAELMNTPNSGAGKVLLTLYEKVGKDDELLCFFSFALPALVEWGVIDSISDLKGPAGKKLLALVDRAKNGSGDMFHFTIRMLLLKGAINKDELKKAFFSEAKWLTNLADATGNMERAERWKVLYFGIETLINAGLIKKGKLSEVFAYEPGHMLYEMAKASYIIDAGRDYFGFLLADWLVQVQATKLSAKVVGEFIRQTAPFAQKFYEAGRRQRERENKSDQQPLWRVTVRNFRGLLPLDDIPRLLDLLAKTLDDPMNTELAVYIQQKQKRNILRPAHIEEVRFARLYAEFLEALTQTAGLKQRWLVEKIDLSGITERYLKSEPEVVFDVVMVLNSFAEGLGDAWLLNAGYSTPAWEGSDQIIAVPVNILNVESIFSRYYLIKVLAPEGLKKYQFVWEKSDPGRLSVSNLAHMIMVFDWLKNLIGDEEASKAVADINVQDLSLDLRGIPEEMMTLPGLNKIRTDLNDRSAAINLGEGGRILMGDMFIAKLMNLLSNAVIVSDDNAKACESGNAVTISLMVKIFLGWSDLSRIGELDHGYDLAGTYKTLAGYMAAAVQNYFDNHQNEFLERPDKDLIRQRCRDLDHPLWLDRKKDMGDELQDFLKTYGE